MGLTQAEMHSKYKHKGLAAPSHIAAEELQQFFEVIRELAISEKYDRNTKGSI